MNFFSWVVFQKISISTLLYAVLNRSVTEPNFEDFKFGLLNFFQAPTLHFEFEPSINIVYEQFNYLHIKYILI